jgi:hypothetical protein
MLLRTVVLLSLGLMMWAACALLMPERSLSTEPFSYWEVQTVLIRDAEGSLRLERDGDGWRIERASESRADPRRVRALIALWTPGLTRTQAIEPSSTLGGADALGFGDDARQLTLLDQSGQTLLDLDLGHRRPGGLIYLRAHGTQRTASAVLPLGPEPSSREADWLLRPKPKD